MFDFFWGNRLIFFFWNRQHYIRIWNHSNSALNTPFSSIDRFKATEYEHHLEKFCFATHASTLYLSSYNFSKHRQSILPQSLFNLPHEHLTIFQTRKSFRYYTPSKWISNEVENVFEFWDNVKSMKRYLVLNYFLMYRLTTMQRYIIEILLTRISH